MSGLRQLKRDVRQYRRKIARLRKQVARAARTAESWPLVDDYLARLGIDAPTGGRRLA